MQITKISYLFKSYNDAKKALQFIRSQAKSWGINKAILVYGEVSICAQTFMWLGFSDEMANVSSKNPIERESTRVTCVATKGGQTTMESDFWRKHIAKYAPDDVVSFRKSILQNYGAKTVKEADEVAKNISIGIASKDDPPIFSAIRNETKCPRTQQCE